ncbi:transcription initiation factor TFIID subunit 3 isoform X3 [Bacillus rossius redtenbacheri]|uniref:transcription initiation factor TFIID subunit 3 isoform X3 n=1 Tax=Bacillus rossius redtenbacheri TaxID=93214 RepID=UPI002FDE5A3E
MASKYSRQMLKVVVAQICQTIGWHSIQETPLDILVGVLDRHLADLCKETRRYAELAGRTEMSIFDLLCTFQDLNVSLLELEDYMRNVDPVPCVFQVPQYPLPCESHLNYLKPGSREVVTRPVHVHEHLPPMYPDMEASESVPSKQTPLTVDTSSVGPSPSSPLNSPKTNVFKRPGDPIFVENLAVKRARLILEEEGRPLREISSVMMTTSGFLSPAREGKLPESRSPLQPSDSRSNSPQPSSYPMVPPEVKGEKKPKKIPAKKSLDVTKKPDKENKKKESKMKDSNKLDKQNFVQQNDDSDVKKLVSMKELSKLKALKPGALKMSASPEPLTTLKIPKIIAKPPPPAKSPECMNFKATVPVVPIKPFKIMDAPQVMPPTVRTIPEKPLAMIEGKLSTEPDKQKLNIFKKISKVKEEKVDRADHSDTPAKDSRESSPGLVIDECELNTKQHEVRMAQIDDCIESVIQMSVELSNVTSPKLVKPKKNFPEVVEATNNKVDSTINEVVLNCAQNLVDDVCLVDDNSSPPRSPTAPKTPEPSSVQRKVEKSPEVKEKTKKKEKMKAKKELLKEVLKWPFAIQDETPEDVKTEALDRPKTPELKSSAPSSVFPFLNFPPGPGLIPPPIPHSLFPRFPLNLSSKNLPHPAMPNLPLPPPHFMQPREDLGEAKEKEKLSDKPVTFISPPSICVPTPQRPGILDKPVLNIMSPVKEKSGEKKSKEHKKEKKDKDKSKKKKDKKEKIKNKEKSDKKKLRLEKKERAREKKEKKKLKEKERILMEEKFETSVPKLTLRIGPSSPKASSSAPDTQQCKIVIKPIVKRSSEEEVENCAPSPLVNVVAAQTQKREPSPELARISALVTRPPKLKSSSKALLPNPETTLVPSPNLSSKNLPQDSEAGSSLPSPLSFPDMLSPSQPPAQIVKAKKLVARLVTKDNDNPTGPVPVSLPEPEPLPVAFYYSFARERKQGFYIKSRNQRKPASIENSAEKI